MPIIAHPDYVIRRKAWAFYGTADSGGTAYVDGTDARGMPMLSRFDGNFETGTAYATRKNLATAPEISNRIVSLTHRFVSKAEWQIGPTGQDSETSTHRKFDAWRANADGAGTDFLDVLHQAGRGAQVYGEYWIGVDTRPIPDGVDRSALSEAEVMALGLKPYLTLYDPLAIVDWDIDAQGNYTRLVVKEEGTRKASLTTQSQSTEQFREWTADGWLLYDKDGQPLEQDMLTGGPAQSEHEFRRVPFFPVYFLDPQSSERRSQLQGIADLERLLFNIDSWHDSELSKAGFTWYAAFGGQFDNPPKQQPMVIGGVAYIDATGIQRMGSDPAVSKALLDRKHEVWERILTNAYLEHERRAIGSNASGERVRLDRLSFNDLLAYTAKERATGGNAVLDFLGGLDIIEPGMQVSPPKEFNERAGEMLLTDIERLQTMPMVPPHAKRLRVEEWVRTEFPNASDDDRKRLESELESDDLFTERDVFGSTRGF